MADNLLSDQITVKYGFNDLDAIAVSVVFCANGQMKNERGSRDECQALTDFKHYTDDLTKLTSSGFVTH